jgi:hypothetical protein
MPPKQGTARHYEATPRNAGNPYATRGIHDSTTRANTGLIALRIKRLQVRILPGAPNHSLAQEVTTGTEPVTVADLDAFTATFAALGDGEVMKGAWE